MNDETTKHALELYAKHWQTEAQKIAFERDKARARVVAVGTYWEGVVESLSLRLDEALQSAVDFGAKYSREVLRSENCRLEIDRKEGVIQSLVAKTLELERERDALAASVEALTAVAQRWLDLMKTTRSGCACLPREAYVCCRCEVVAALDRTKAAPKAAPPETGKAAMTTLCAALMKMHARACGDQSAVYMSVPADRTRDADLLLSDALDELAGYRALDSKAPRG